MFFRPEQSFFRLIYGTNNDDIFFHVHGLNVRYQFAGFRFPLFYPNFIKHQPPRSIPSTFLPTMLVLSWSWTNWFPSNHCISMYYFLRCGCHQWICVICIIPVYIIGLHATLMNRITSDYYYSHPNVKIRKKHRTTGQLQNHVSVKVSGPRQVRIVCIDDAQNCSWSPLALLRQPL